MVQARTLRDAYNNADPVQPLPAGDVRYVDCTPVRGNEDIVSQMLKKILWSESRFTAQLFIGHRGCGKSTELLRLQARLEEAGYIVLYFESDDDLDLNDIEYTDLLLAIAQRLVSDLEIKGIRVRDSLLNEVEAWCNEVFYTEEQRKEVGRELATEAELGIGLPKELPLVARLLARVTAQVKTGRTVKTEIRRKLDSQVSQLIANVNLLLRDIHAKILKKGQQGLVLIVDNLDRIVFRDLGNGRTSHTAFYVEHGEQLRDLNCHLIYTVPISLMYSDRATVVQSIFPDCHVLPMIKVCDRENRPYQPGLDHLRDMLAARVDLDTLCTPDAVTYLCEASGGHPRDLMFMVRQACVYAPSDVWPRPITLDVIKRAEAQLVATYSRMIPEAHYNLLAHVHMTKQVQADEAHELMLYNLSVLEYINGTPPWHDVHPAVRKLPKFQAALQEERAKTGLVVQNV